MKTKTLILCIILLYINVNLLAQNHNCSDLIPEDSDLGYKNLGNRCEGYYVPKYAGSLQLVSFTEGPIQFSLTDSTILTISLSKKVEIPLNIRAISLPRNLNYQLDASLNNGEELTWPAYPFIVKRNINQNKLGAYAWTGIEEEKIFIPVKLGEVGSIFNIDSLKIKFRPITDLTHFRWQLYNVDDENVCVMNLPLTEQNDYKGEMSAGNIIEITIPNDRIMPKNICIEIKYRPENRGWFSDKLKLYLGE